METIDTLPFTASRLKCINLNYLKRITHSNPGAMTKIMALYLDQVPPLLRSLRKGHDEQDWKTVFESSHKLIPSFAIMGINREFEVISKLIQNTAGAGHTTPELPHMIKQLEDVCAIACCEVESELHMINRETLSAFPN